MSKELKRICTLISIAFLVAIIYFLFFNYNNKYTYDQLRAENGTLNLNENFILNPITFLIGQWEFYEGYYSPQTLKRDKPEPSIFINLEEHPWEGSLDYSPDKNGGGTFRMNIQSSSKGTQKYILEIPEIKSPYCLWINGEKTISCAGSDYGNYLPETANNYIVFSGEDTIEIVFYISDIFSADNPVSYPPAFGHLERVSRYLTLNLIFSAFFFSASVAIGCLYTLSIVWTKYKASTLAIIFLCISLAWLSAYPIIHFINLPGIHIWFIWKRFFYNVLLLSVVHLQAIICKNKTALTRFLLLAGLCFCFASPIVSSAEINHQFLSVMYTNAEIIYRLIVSAYLAVQSARGIIKNKARPVLMAYGIFIFAFSIPEEIFLMDYEPLYIGLPYQLGLLVFIGIFTVYISREPLELYHANKEALMQNTFLKETSKIIEEQLIVQENQYKLIAEYVEKANSARHDLRHHIYAIKNYADSGDMEKLNIYLTNYIDHINEGSALLYCKNTALNALIKNYADKCACAKIKFDASVDITEDICVTNYDLCIIFGNCLENAYEACGLMKSGEKFIKVKTRMQGNLLSLQFVNSYDGITEKNGKEFISRKKNRDTNFPDASRHKIRGIGTASVQAVAEKYNGAAQFEFNENIFSVSVLLKIKKQAQG